MSSTEQGRVSAAEHSRTRPDVDVRGRTTDSFNRPSFRETKPSFMTTEFWAMLAGIAALIIVYNVASNPSLDLWRTCLLCTIGAMAYIVSRGIAKSGSRDSHWDYD